MRNDWILKEFSYNGKRKQETVKMNSRKNINIGET